MKLTRRFQGGLTLLTTYQWSKSLDNASEDQGWWVNDARRDDFQKVVGYLKSEPAQLWLARTTLRRPIVPEVAAKVADILPSVGLRVELPFSPDRALADGLIDAYLNEFRAPIASTFVLDTSGSMDGNGRRQQLVQAIHYIAGADASLTGRIAKLTNREKLWLQPFSEQPYGRTVFEIPGGAPNARGVQIQADSEAKQKVLGDVREFADGLRMTGGTALYDAVLLSLQNMLEEKKKNPNYQYSVVAFTDGENNKGRSLDQFKRDYALLPEDVRGIPVFMVLFGEAQEIGNVVIVTASDEDDGWPRLRCAQDAAVQRLQGHPCLPVAAISAAMR